MNLHKLIFTNNLCYKNKQIIEPKGIMVHSTGANNPELRRYVGPDDGVLGKNSNGNHWNRSMSRKVCVHGFIGKTADGTIATYQTLPWNYRAWHAAGKANQTHIAFEICEDGLTDSVYFSKVYKEAVEFCAYLCRMFNLNPLADGVVIGHYEGYRRGIANNHADPQHWFKRHGKSMDTFRSDVKKAMTTGSFVVQVPTVDSSSIASNAASAVGAAIASGIYTVKKGETMFQIAKKLKTTVDILAKLNEIKDPSRIRIGQKLKIPNSLTDDWVPKIGDIVEFEGTAHYKSANGDTVSTCKSGKAKITQIYRLGKSRHPYHLSAVPGSGSTVNGWVDVGSFLKG